MKKFTQRVAETAAFWEDQSEEALEEALQKNMPKIMSDTLELWTELYNSDSSHSSFAKERAVVPSQLLKYIGGYKSGPGCWNWEAFPFRAVGQQLLSAMKPQCDVGEIRKSLIRALPEEVPCSRYSATHKIRTLAVCYGLLGSFHDSWCGCESMSTSNAELFSALGKPSPNDFESLTGRRSPAWELGYQMCFVAPICKQYAQLIDEDWPEFKRQLQSLPGACDPWESPVLSLKRQLRLQVEAAGEAREIDEEMDEEGVPMALPRAPVSDPEQSPEILDDVMKLPNGTTAVLRAPRGPIGPYGALWGPI